MKIKILKMRLNQRVIEMNENIETLIGIVEKIESAGEELVSLKAEIREKEFDLKVKRSAMEFAEEYADFREGLKVKEIPPKILEATIEPAQELCRLKQERDELEHELYVLKLRFQLIKEIIDDSKQ